MVNLQELFEKYEGKEYGKFSRVENKLSVRPDLCAFILLDKLVPNPGSNIVRAAEHDEFYIDIDMDELAKAATNEDILTLIRCRVQYSDELDSLFITT